MRICRSNYDSAPRFRHAGNTTNDSTMKRTPIIIDTREQKPLDFSPFDDVRVIRTKLWPGDYSLQAATRYFSVERKSVSDLVGTMLNGYAGIDATSPKRFDATLLGMAGIIRLGGIAFVLIEPDSPDKTSKEEIERGDFKSTLTPDVIFAFIHSIENNYHVPVKYADSRTHSAEIVREAAKLVESLKWAKRDIHKFNVKNKKEKQEPEPWENW